MKESNILTQIHNALLNRSCNSRTCLYIQAVIREGGSSAGKNVDIKKHLEYVNHEQMYVELTTELSVGDTVRLNIVFNGTLTDNLAGFYRSSYDTSTGEKR